MCDAGSDGDPTHLLGDLDVTSSDRYTHGHHESVLRSHAWRTAENSAGFLLPHLRDGMRLLDVGCGVGTITIDLASRLPNGSVVGIDLPSDLVANLEREHGGPNLHFATGDVYALAFPDDSFDVVYAHQVLQHLGDPIAALREMRRVLRPDGLLAVRDSDYSAFEWTPADPVLDEWLRVYHLVTERNGAEADAGRYLHEWVREAGFVDVEPSWSSWVFDSPANREWWGSTWADRARHSDFARQAVEYGFAADSDLQRISDAFLRWAAAPDGRFVLWHGEVLASKG